MHFVHAGGHNCCWQSVSVKDIGVAASSCHNEFQFLADLFRGLFNSLDNRSALFQSQYRVVIGDIAFH